MSIFFIADTHFGDDSIRRYENRPFATVEEMDGTIIKNWNETVSDEDTVYLVGDVGDVNKLSVLNGKIILIRGNHDKLPSEEYKACGVLGVYDLPVVYENFWILSHEPMYVNRNAPYANIFGHIHDNPQYRTVSERSFCVSVERIGYKPVSFEEIVRRVKEEDEKRSSC